MALLSEFALTPDVFDLTSYSSEEICGVHLQHLKEVLLHEGLVRDLRHGEWGRLFLGGSRSWHQRGKELLKKLVSQQRLVAFPPAIAKTPGTDVEWCDEALATHRAPNQLAGIIVSDALGGPHRANPLVASVSNLSSAPWWAARSSSFRLGRTLAAYQSGLELVLRHANSIMLIDPYFDPTESRYRDAVTLLVGAGGRTPRPLIEIHRVAWYGTSHDKRPQLATVEGALRPALAIAAKRSGLSFDVFLWDDFHDRFLISDLVGISVPHGFDTTTAPSAVTTWTRLGRNDRDDVQREFDPASSRHTLSRRFVVP
jgi:hypothetical protein